MKLLKTFPYRRSFAAILPLVMLVMFALSPRQTLAESLGLTTPHEAALVVFNGTMYLVYKNESDGLIHLESTTDGSTWGNDYTLPNQPPAGYSVTAGVSAAVWNGNLYIATTVPNPSNYDEPEAMLINSPNLTTWNYATYPGLSFLFNNSAYGGMPVLAADGNNFVMAWTDYNLKVMCIYCQNYAAGTTTTLTATSGCVPSITAAPGGGFFLSARSSNWMVTFASSTSSPLSFTEESSIDNHTLHGPGATTLSGYYYLGWPDNPNDYPQLATYQVTSGSPPSLTFVSQSQDPAGATSASNPSLEAFNGHLYYEWLNLSGGINVNEIF